MGKKKSDNTCDRQIDNYVITSTLILEALAFLVKAQPCECPDTYDGCRRCRLIRDIREEQ